MIIYVFGCFFAGFVIGSFLEKRKTKKEILRLADSLSFWRGRYHGSESRYLDSLNR